MHWRARSTTSFARSPLQRAADGLLLLAHPELAAAGEEAGTVCAYLLLPPSFTGAKKRTPEGEKLPLVWLRGLPEDSVPQLTWLTLTGKALADRTRKLEAVLSSKEQATRAGFGAEINSKAPDRDAFKRGVRFGETGWDAATDKQLDSGRVWRFTGNTQGTVTEATPEEAEAILGPYNAVKA